MSSEVSAAHPWNMPLKTVPWEVSELAGRLSVESELQFWNISVKSAHFEVLKLAPSFSSRRPEQSWNIPRMY